MNTIAAVFLSLAGMQIIYAGVSLYIGRGGTKWFLLSAITFFIGFLINL